MKHNVSIYLDSEGNSFRVECSCGHLSTVGSPAEAHDEKMAHLADGAVLR